jgi:hypothetical protein
MLSHSEAASNALFPDGKLERLRCDLVNTHVEHLPRNPQLESPDFESAVRAFGLNRAIPFHCLI